METKQKIMIVVSFLLIVSVSSLNVASSNNDDWLDNFHQYLGYVRALVGTNITNNYYTTTSNELDPYWTANQSNYYTKTEADSSFVDSSGDTMTGDLDMNNNNINNVKQLKLGWGNLTNFPSNCSAGDVVTGFDASGLYCTTPSSGGENSYKYHNRLFGGSITKNTIFDALSPYIPNIGDNMIVSGGGTGNTPGGTSIFVFSSAKRDSTTRILLYSVYMSYTGSIGTSPYYIDDGSTTVPFSDLNLAW